MKKTYIQPKTEVCEVESYLMQGPSTLDHADSKGGFFDEEESEEGEPSGQNIFDGGSFSSKPQNIWEY